MNRVPLAAGMAVLLFVGGSLHASESMKAVVASYIAIHDRLFRDNMEGVKQAAATIEQQASRMGATGAAIVKAAQNMEAAADLKTARESFGTLSDAVIAAGNAEGWKDLPDVKRAYCPMAKKSWLQKDGSIRNPYYGPVMPTCGEFKKD